MWVWSWTFFSTRIHHDTHQQILYAITCSGFHIFHSLTCHFSDMRSCESILFWGERESSNNSVTVLWWSRAQSENGRTEKNSIKTETFSIFILSINWPLRTRSTGEFIYNNCKFIFEMRFCSARLTLQSASVSNFTVWRTSNSSKVLIEIKLEFFFCNWMGLKFELHQWKKSC